MTVTNFFHSIPGVTGRPKLRLAGEGQHGFGLLLLALLLGLLGPNLDTELCLDKSFHPDPALGNQGLLQRTDSLVALLQELPRNDNVATQSCLEVLRYTYSTHQTCNKPLARAGTYSWICMNVMQIIHTRRSESTIGGMYHCCPKTWLVLLHKRR